MRDRYKTLYRNVHATCIWLSTNILGVTHMTTFYNQVFHIVHVLMTINNFACVFNRLIPYAMLKISNLRNIRSHYLCLFLLPKFIEVGCLWMSIIRYIVIELWLHLKVKLHHMCITFNKLDERNGSCWCSICFIRSLPKMMMMINSLNKSHLKTIGNSW